MATSLGLMRRLLPANSAQYLSLQLERRFCCVLQVARPKQCSLTSSCRMYSNKVLEGMGEFLEEDHEENYDVLLDHPFPQHSHDYPWRHTRRWHARQYATFGKASEVDPSIIWPTKAELIKLIEEENQYFPSLLDMQTELAAEKRAADLETLKREKLIAANMAKMPKMIEEYRKKVREERDQLKAQKAKRSNLLAMAKEKLGYAVDPRSPRFKQMVEEMEAEEKKRRKELKKKGIKV